MSTDPPIRDLDIAIVGQACRVPGADTPDAFWQMVEEGREAVVDVGASSLRASGVTNAELADPHYVRRAAIMRDVMGFDAGFFGLSALDAALLDPQHRHFLEVCWEALESAAHAPARFDGRIGVFAGVGMQGYFANHLLPNAALMREHGLFLVRHTGNDKDFLPTRVSYEFDLRGPSVAVQTACSTSLVAVHIAAQSLLNMECDLALAGGVTIELPHGV
ncbi:MAG: acyl transferase domain-containing protein, partial [Bradymonadia bacterium]